MNFTNEILVIRRQIENREYLSKEQIDKIIKSLTSFISSGEYKDIDECLNVYEMYYFINVLYNRIIMHESFIDALLSNPMQDGYPSTKTSNILKEDIQTIDWLINRRQEYTNKYFFSECADDWCEYKNYKKNLVDITSKYDSITKFHAKTAIQDGLYFHQLSRLLYEIYVFNLANNENIHSINFGDDLKKVISTCESSFSVNGDFSYTKDKFDDAINVIKVLSNKSDDKSVHENLFYSVIVISQKLGQRLYQSQLNETNGKQIIILHNTCREIMIGGSQNE